MRILVVDSDPLVCRAMEFTLIAASMSPYTSGLGEDAIDLAKIYAYDLITIDMSLVDMSGRNVLRALRIAKVETPVLVLSGLPSVEEKVQALDLGADDYLEKPFHAEEFIARIRAIVRRSKGHSANVIHCGPLEVDLGERSAYVAGTCIHLTGKEFLMLELLALRKGTTLTKEMFLNHLYGGMDEPELKIIDVFICKLRRKLAAAGAAGIIETMWGRGYVLRDPAGRKVAA